MIKTISIIVVILDFNDKLLLSLNSILIQSFENYEVILKFKRKCSNAEIALLNNLFHKKKINIICCNDLGIFDAMNQAITYSKNEFIYFLNSGDTFYSNNTLLKISKKLNAKKIFYGDIIINNKLYSSARNWFSYKLKGIHHQSLFIHRSFFCNSSFDLNYKLLADREFLFKNLPVYKRKNKFDVVISICDLDFSRRINNHFLLYCELLKIIYKNNNFVTFTLLLSYQLFTLQFFRGLAKKIFR